jgi:multicomponent Na+:H+ antiporter subunit A
MALFLVLVAHLLPGLMVLVGGRKRPAGAAVVGLGVLAATAAVAVRGGVTNTPTSASWEWISELGFTISLRLDGFAVLMTLLVSILGIAVLAYSIAYFDHDANYAKFVGLFMAFAASMTGLVMASDLFTMFVFWELTSIWSFLLIGMNDRSASARKAAVRALLTTGAGGLCLLAGVALLHVSTGTTSFSELAELAPSGTLVNVAAALLLLGAFTKSAQFPFHFWLPGAMAAPTPVSAYLHSATMVKAGVVLLARTSPIFADAGVWRWWVVVAGGATMLIGGYSAMRQTDAKLLLAHSTVSQLGLLTILMGIGTPLATYAGVAHLAAHAIFKIGLFLGVGVIDHELGTRDIRVIAAARKHVPFTVAAIGLGSLSMAGVIPLFGFVTKEKALVALLEAELGSASSVALVLVVVGSVLSVAYSVRLMRAFFGPVDTAAEGHHHGSRFSRVLLEAPVVLAGFTSLLFGFLATRVGKWLLAPATSIDPTAASKLVLWPGINTALITSVVVVLVGAVVGSRIPLDQSRGTGARGEQFFDALYDGVLRAAKRITSVTQSGSLPLYVAATTLVVGSAATAGLLRGSEGFLLDFVDDSPLTIVIVVLAGIFAVATAVVQVRFTAAFLLGGVGFGIALLFALRGAPDLAVTQLLVETLTIVIFLIALRRMPRTFAPSPQFMPRSVRVLVSAAVGVVVPLFALRVVGARTGGSVSGEYFARSVQEAGGRNVVNVILVDFRGFDTLGEITVLAVAALGVVNLVRAAERMRRAKTSEGVAR